MRPGAAVGYAPLRSAAARMVWDRSGSGLVRLLATPMSLAAGQTLSHYEILGALGAGAMGEVYRARDTRLEREVALKVLPEELACDEERMRRFDREAKSLASLNHPNVAQVFGIDQVGDTCFMAMELVQGEDLAACLSRGALPFDEALDVCHQIAQGVEAAHEAGVIHRDLKPANVMLTPEGKVKVLDFGLAKSAETGPGASSTADTVLATQEGRLMGTPTYMAPEQARGKPVDKRVDLWAFGCVLYECLSGRRAFGGGSLGEVLAAVLNDEPDWGRLPTETPARVRGLLVRCLDKDPRTRLRDVGEARILLEGGDVPGSAPASGKRLVWPLVAAAALFAIGALVAALVIKGSPPAGPRNPLQNPRTIKKLIDWPGTEFDAAISRDGNLFAFASDRDGQLDAWVGQIDRGMPRNLTNGDRDFWALKVRDIYFDLDAANVCLVGEKDGPPMRVDVMSSDQRVSPLGTSVINPTWSPDGTRITFHLDVDGDPLFVGDANGQGRVEISRLEKGMHQHYATWSADGEWIYVSRGLPATHMDLWRIRPDGSFEEQLTSGKRDVAYPTPIDDDTVLFVANEADGAGPWLWVLDVRGRGAARRQPAAGDLGAGGAGGGRAGAGWSTPAATGRAARGADYSPVDLYAASKRAFQALLRFYEEARGVRALTLRLHGTYGPGDRRGKVVELLIGALDDPQPLEMSPGRPAPRPAPRGGRRPGLRGRRRPGGPGGDPAR